MLWGGWKPEDTWNSRNSVYYPSCFFPPYIFHFLSPQHRGDSITSRWQQHAAREINQLGHIGLFLKKADTHFLGGENGFCVCATQGGASWKRSGTTTWDRRGGKIRKMKSHLYAYIFMHICVWHATCHWRLYTWMQMRNTRPSTWDISV